jgi:hypothetical protein
MPTDAAAPLMGASPCAAAASINAPARTPASTRAVRFAASMEIPVIARVLMSRAPSAGVVNACPVACTATGRSCAAA